MSEQVNRYLKDKEMDRIDHALGRPVNPMGETFRSHYCASESDIEYFRESPYWTGGSERLGATIFHVSDEGRCALAKHLKDIGDPHRKYILSYRNGEFEDQEIIGKSRSHAKYQHWLAVGDCFDMTFIEYMKRISVRLASGKAGA